jgi:hypothetical protein
MRADLTALAEQRADQRRAEPGLVLQRFDRLHASQAIAAWSTYGIASPRAWSTTASHSASRAASSQSRSRISGLRIVDPAFAVSCAFLPCPAAPGFWSSAVRGTKTSPARSRLERASRASISENSSPSASVGSGSSATAISPASRSGSVASVASSGWGQRFPGSSRWSRPLLPDRAASKGQRGRAPSPACGQKSVAGSAAQHAPG